MSDVKCECSSTNPCRWTPTGELPAVMIRTTVVFNLFRFFVVLITVLGIRLVQIGRKDRKYVHPTWIAFIICIVFVTPTIFGGGTVSIVYVKIIKWILQHLHTTEEHRWVVALGITALCDVFMNTMDMSPFLVLSALSMVMICVVAEGWDSDRSGMTEGLLIGFGKLLVVHMISLNLLPSFLCGAVLILAITAKLTESTVVEIAGNPLNGTTSSTTSAEA